MALAQNICDTRERAPDGSEDVCPRRVRTDWRSEVTDAIITAGPHLAKRQIAAQGSLADGACTAGESAERRKGRTTARHAATGQFAVKFEERSARFRPT